MIYEDSFKKGFSRCMKEISLGINGYPLSDDMTAAVSAARNVGLHVNELASALSDTLDRLEVLNGVGPQNALIDEFCKSKRAMLL